MERRPKLAHVYYLKDFTAPKVWTGTYFECLLTDQRIKAKTQIVSDEGLISDWPYEIWNKERFASILFLAVLTEKKS